MKNNLLKVSIVGYLNTKPFIYGLTSSDIWNKIDLSLEIPSVCADDFFQNKCSISLLPVAVLPKLSNYRIITDFCIGAKDHVNTVCMYSNSNLDEIDTIYLDNHSKTSVQLIQVLNEKYWKKNIKFCFDKHVSNLDLKDNEGVLMIGDKTIGQDLNYKFVIDLGHEWYKYTGFPFVFAVWVADTTVSDFFIEKFNNALKKGIADIGKLKYLLQSPHDNFDLQQYFNEYINYSFGLDEKKGLKMFLDIIKKS